MPASDHDEIERSVVWMLGSPRTGSTWLLRLIAHPWGIGHGETVIEKSRFRPRGPDVVPVNESYLAHHLALLRGDAVLRPNAPVLVNELRRGHPSYFFSDAYRDDWLPATRDLALRRFEAQRRRAATEHDLAPDAPIVIKEPNGSHGAEHLIDLMPSSRILFLLRDGRDVVDSMLAADAPGGWRTRLERVEPVDSREKRAEAIERQAALWLLRTEATERAFRRLPEERRLLVRYEDLLHDTAGELTRVDRWLGLDRSEATIRGAVRRHRFNSLRNRLRGERMGIRAASPGLWRHNLDAREQALLNRQLGPKLAELGYRD